MGICGRLKYLAANVGKAIEVAQLFVARVAAQRAGDRLGSQAEKSVRACSKNAAVLLHLVPILRYRERVVAVDGVVGGPTILVTGEPRIRLLTVAVGVQVRFLPLVQGVGATVVFLLLVRAALLSGVGVPLVLQHEGLQLPVRVVDGGVRWLLPDVCVVCLWTRRPAEGAR